MFERRLKIFLGCLCAVAFVIAVRAAQVQVVDHDQWIKAAAETMRRAVPVDTVRGSLLDVRGRVIARDEACVDACVDYRALTDPPDEGWVNDRALERLKARPGDAYAKAPKSKRKQMVADEADAVRGDLKSMWEKLAQVSGRTPGQIAEARDAIVHRVETRRRLVWYRSYERAVERQAKQPATTQPFWMRWLDENRDEPQLDQFSVTVAEQNEAHPLLKAIDLEAQNELGRHIERYPGLVLRASTHRIYPLGPTGCHILGRVSKVTQEDLQKDPERSNELRAYQPNDDIGRGGVEALCERALRGWKGMSVRTVGESNPVSRTEPVPGKDVRITIDMELQARVEDAFAHAELGLPKEPIEHTVLHGACVIIDVPTGEVRALVSYPTFDPNSFDEHYAELYNDQVNQPLLNRATMSQLQPGSTVKPMVGLSAITAGVMTANDTIECTGYLVINGRRQSVGRCWVASKFGELLHGQVAHHPVPWDAPHPTGFLTYSDALERSCNVFFETVADRMGMEGLSYWYDKFGLGRPTGIGIAEARGRLPRDYKGPLWDRRYKTWFSGIGQDPVAATPIQMANVAATIARNGIWMRPRLVPDAEAANLGIVVPPPTTRPGEPPASTLDRVDLHLSPEGLAAARDGMYRVVNGKAGTGKQIIQDAKKLEHIPICGKTGTAQAPRFAMKMLDAKHQPVLDEKGRQRYLFLDPSTKEHPNPIAPWYRGYGKEGKDLNHAWYIGFAPADHPRIAFAVMVEYGGSGGFAAGAVGRKALEACVDLGYLK